MPNANNTYSNFAIYRVTQLLSTSNMFYFNFDNNNNNNNNNNHNNNNDNNSLYWYIKQKT